MEKEQKRFQKGHQVMVDGKLYTVDRYDGVTGDVIMKDSGGETWSETQEKVYAQNPVIGEKYYDTEFGPVSEADLQASELKKQALKSEYDLRKHQESVEASKRIQEIKENMARLDRERREKWQQATNSKERRIVDQEYKKQRSELSKGVKENQKTKAKSFLNRVFNKIRMEPKKEFFDPIKFLEEKRKQKDWPTNPEPYSGAFATYNKETRYLKFDGVETYLMGYDGYTGDALLMVMGKKGEWVIPVPQEELYRQNQYVAAKVAELENQPSNQDVAHEADESTPTPEIVPPQLEEEEDFDEDEDQIEGNTEEEEEELRQFTERVKKFEQLNEKIHAYTIETLQKLNVPLSKDIDLKQKIHDDMMANLDQIKSEGTYSEKTPTVQKIADKQIGKEVLAYAKELDDAEDDEFKKEMRLNDTQEEFDEIIALFDESTDHDYTLSPEKSARLGELFRSKDNIPNIDGSLPEKPAVSKTEETKTELSEDIKAAIEAGKRAYEAEKAKERGNELGATSEIDESEKVDSSKELDFLKKYLDKYNEITATRGQMEVLKHTQDFYESGTEGVLADLNKIYEKKLNELIDLTHLMPADYPYAEDPDTVRLRFAELNGYKFDEHSGKVAPNAQEEREVFEI